MDRIREKNRKRGLRGSLRMPNVAIVVVLRSTFSPYTSSPIFGTINCPKTKALMK